MGTQCPVLTYASQLVQGFNNLDPGRESYQYAGRCVAAPRVFWHCCICLPMPCCPPSRESTRLYELCSLRSNHMLVPSSASNMQVHSPSPCAHCTPSCAMTRDLHNRLVCRTSEILSLSGTVAANYQVRALAHHLARAEFTVNNDLALLSRPVQLPLQRSL